MENRTHDSHLNIEEIYRNLDDQVHQAMSMLSDWTEQGRQLIRERPELVIAGIALGGFATGLLARESESERLIPRPRGFRMDPLLVFFGSAIAGFVFGPPLLDKLSQGQGPKGPRRVESITPH